MSGRLRQLEALTEVLVARLGWRRIPPVSNKPTGGCNRRGGSHSPQRVQAANLAARVDRACRALRLKDGCLPRAVALYHMLRRRRIESDFRLGVRYACDELEAHAWLEIGGDVLIGDLPDLDEFVSMKGLPWRGRVPSQTHTTGKPEPAQADR